MARAKHDRRRLIKFSNYSMCITLPKWVLDELKWQKGDLITLESDVSKGRITLSKDSKNQAPRSSTADELSGPVDREDEKKPKLRW